MEIYIAFVRTSREGWNSLSVRWKSKREQVIETFMRKGAGGGVLELFFDGVCGPRSETPTHI